MKLLRLLLLLALASRSSAGFAEERSLHGDLTGRYAVATARGESALGLLEGNLTGGLETEDLLARLGLRLRTEHYLEPEPSNRFEVRQAELAYRYDSWLFSLGRQSVVWGKSDGFRVLDIVNPFSYREFILEAMVSARLPLTMARVERRTGEGGMLQLLLIPEFRRDRLPSPEGRFASVWPQLEIDARAREVGRPDPWKPGDWQYGAKWEQNSGRFSYTLNLLEKWGGLPSYRPASDVGVEAHFNRQTFLGGSLDFPLGDLVLRGEATYSPSLTLPARDLRNRRYSQLSGVVGVDKSLEEWFLSGQIFHTSSFGDAVAPLQDRTHDIATFMLMRAFDQDRTKLRLFVAHDLTDDGTWGRVTLSHEPFPLTEVAVGGDLFFGSSASSFGTLKNQDRIFLNLKRSF